MTPSASTSAAPDMGRKKPSLHLTHYEALTPPHAMAPVPEWAVPTDARCFAWWDDYDMLPNVRDHSLLVAEVATVLAGELVLAGMDLDVPSVRASALLHDLGKTYCIRHGGNHSQLGSAWAMQLTGNPLIAAGVLHHVFWPFDLDINRYALPLLVIYGDKRVKHDKLVGIADRYVDLFARYGQTEQIRARIHMSMQQALDIENALNEFLGVELDECTFDSGRLVRGA